MKKLLFALLFLPSLAWSAFQPVTGATVTIFTTAFSDLPVKVSTGGLTAAEMVLVSSNTSMPTAVGDTLNVRPMADKFGRAITLPIAPQPLVKVATATITTNTNWIVFIASASAPNYNNLIGCIGQNTSATNTYVNFQPGCGTAAGSFTLGMPANDVPVGFFPPGGIPQATTATDWCLSGANSVTSLLITCWYYVTP